MSLPPSLDWVVEDDHPGARSGGTAMWLGILAVAVLLIGAALVGRVVVGNDAESRICTLGAPVDTPLASTPEAAFVAWIEKSGSRRAVAVGASSGDVRVSDFERSGDTWEWRYEQDRGLIVEVSRTGPEDAYRVTEVDDCEYGDF